MQYAFFSTVEEASYEVCLLVPNIRKEEIKQAYLDSSGLDPNKLMVIGLHYDQTKKKTPMGEMRRFITEELAPVLADLKVKAVLCADGEYFKALTKAPKIEANLGYAMDCPFGDFKVFYVPSYGQIFYDPDKTRSKIKQSMDALLNFLSGSYLVPGNNVIKFADYPATDEAIEDWLVKLVELGQPLAADIEGFSLKHYACGIGSLTLCWNQGEGIAFSIDYVPVDKLNPFQSDSEGNFGYQAKNAHRRALLKRFFEICHERGIKLMWHSIGFDVYVLIYQLFMEHILDQEGLLYGLKIMLGDGTDQAGNWDCTKLITYLATNSCAGNKLGLKDNAQEYSGNYAMDDIKDIRKIPEPTLLQYNLVDGLSTWYVFNKHYSTMINDNQLPVYKELFQPAMVDIIQMQLTGMPVNMKKVLEVEQLLLADEKQATDTIHSTNVMQQFTHRLNEKWVRTKNETLKVKRVTLADAKEVFNPNSSPQLQDLLFGFLGLPVLSLTDSKQPSTDGDTLKALQFHTTDPDVLAFLKAMVDYKAVNKIITDFIPSLKNAQQGNDGWHYLFGNFNLGGTKSGRLSSSNPNLQNLPANSKYAKLIKMCFEAPPGWLFCGLDFASLEDRISALTTKDPNKIKVYTDGYDGHSLRAYAYFGDQMPDIDPDSVVSINSIQDKYKPQRHDSKAPTFALTYQGTFKTLMTNCGFSEEKALMVEAKYHTLYEVSDKWVADRLDEASRDGYVTVAFGLRLRTPLLYQVIRGNSKTPFQAEAEGRTAGNALGQSYCLLNTRAGVEFNAKVRACNHRLVIRPSAHIHDAQYFIIKDDITVIKYANDNLVKAVQWQEDPAIQHNDVKLGGEFGIFYPNWSKEITLPNGASTQDIFEVIDKAIMSTK
jgi:DNA polymerase-1